MHELGKELKPRFRKASSQAKSSLKLMGEIIELAFKIIGHPHDKNLKREIKAKSKEYEKLAKQTTTDYWDGIEDAFKGTFDNFFGSSQDDDDDKITVCKKLKKVFKKSSKRAEYSVVSFGKSMAKVWLHLLANNNTIKSKQLLLLEAESQFYINYTGKACSSFWQNISNSFTVTFNQLFPGLQNMTVAQLESSSNTFVKVNFDSPPDVVSGSYPVGSNGLTLTVMCSFVIFLLNV
jgi:hypothetical protein